MKFLLMAGVLLFVGLGPAKAQFGTSVGSGTTVGGGNSINGSSTVNSRGGTNYSGPLGTGSVGADQRATHSISGTNPGEFVPSTFESYDSAVMLGQEWRNQHPLTVAEAARMAQKSKAAAAAKPTITVDKDAEGKLIVLYPRS